LNNGIIAGSTWFLPPKSQLTGKRKTWVAVRSWLDAPINWKHSLCRTWVCLNKRTHCGIVKSTEWQSLKYIRREIKLSLAKQAIRTHLTAVKERQKKARRITSSESWSRKVVIRSWKLEFQKL